MLELLGAVRVLEDEGVQVLLASDLELDLVVLLVLLYPRSCHSHVSPASPSRVHCATDGWGI